MELGVWWLVLRCAPYSTENSEELFRRVPAVITFRNPFGVALQIQLFAISGETLTPAIYGSDTLLESRGSSLHNVDEPL